MCTTNQETENRTLSVRRLHRVFKNVGGKTCACNSVTKVAVDNLRWGCVCMSATAVVQDLAVLLSVLMCVCVLASYLDVLA